MVGLSSPCAAGMRQVRGTRMAAPAIRPVRRFDALPTWPLARIPSPLQSAAANIGRESQSLTCASVSRLWSQGTLRRVVAQGLRSCSSARVAPAASPPDCRNVLGTDSSKIWAGRLQPRLSWLDVESPLAARQSAPPPHQPAARCRMQYS